MRSRRGEAILIYMKGLILKARYLRHEETKTEKILWEELRNRKLGVKFRRQHPIDKFILDFYAPEIKFGIELDGSDHKENHEYNKLRTEYLKTNGIKIIRFWNSEVENNINDVIRKIKEAI
jgi:very-short-patch-repair endonuclease